jgi:hypothetical protein
VVRSVAVERTQVASVIGRPERFQKERKKKSTLRDFVMFYSLTMDMKTATLYLPQVLRQSHFSNHISIFSCAVYF